MRNFRHLLTPACAAVLVTAGVSIGHAAADPPGPTQLIGMWRGTSICTNRTVAPACHDETVVYEFASGSEPGTVHWVADKIVDGRRERMGEFDLKYDTSESCWKAEFSSPRVKVVWRISVDGARMSGTGRVLPGNEIVRKLDLQKVRPSPRKTENPKRKP
jgi:hypothetical protein